MRNYMKKQLEQFEDIQSESIAFNSFNKKKVLLSVGMFLITAFCLVALFICKSPDSVALSDSEGVGITLAPIAATAGKKSVITIPVGTVKANPFLPYRDIGGAEKALDVPTFSLVEPPEVVNENSDAARVMDTIVSGILYDKFSPSAILNIEGNDYLVKKGDVVNNYNIVNIAQDSVTVKLGANVYKAGIGEILTEGSLTHNDVSNLSNKFGGGNNGLQ